MIVVGFVHLDQSDDLKDFVFDPDNLRIHFHEVHDESMAVAGLNDPVDVRVYARTAFAFIRRSFRIGLNEYAVSYLFVFLNLKNRVTKDSSFRNQQDSLPSPSAPGVPVLLGPGFEYLKALTGTFYMSTDKL